MCLKPIKFLVWKILGQEKSFRLKENFEKKIRGKINFGSGKFMGQKKNWSKKTIKKILGPKKFLGLKKFWSILVHKNYEPKKLGPKSLIKIGPVTSNVTRADVAWTNIPITIGINKWSQDPTFKVWSKSDQQKLRYS